VLDHEAVEASNRVRVAALTALALGALASSATLALAILAFAILARAASYSSSLSVASTLACALLRHINAELL
jgi:hypothetical protein